MIPVKPHVCSFDLAPVVFPRPHCKVCNRLIESGYAYIHPDPVTKYPTMDTWCRDHAPLWVKDTADSLEGTIPPGDTAPHFNGGTEEKEKAA